MYRLAVLVNNFAASPMNFSLIKCLNELATEYWDQVSPVGLYEELKHPCEKPEFPTMQLFEGWGYSGSIIATSLSTAAKLINFPATNKKYFYVYDHEWCFFEQKDLIKKKFSVLQGVYAHPELKLIVRNENSRRLVENNWGAKTFKIVEDFGMADLLSILEE